MSSESQNKNDIEQRLQAFQKKYHPQFDRIKGTLDKHHIQEIRVQSFPFIVGDFGNQEREDRPHQYNAPASILAAEFMQGMQLAHLKSEKGSKEAGSMGALHVDPNFPNNGVPYFSNPDTFMELMKGWLDMIAEKGADAVEKGNGNAQAELASAYNTIYLMLEEWQNTDHLKNLYADACKHALETNTEETAKKNAQEQETRGIAKKDFIEMAKKSDERAR